MRKTFCHRISVSMRPNTTTLLTASEMQVVARPGLLRRAAVLQHDIRPLITQQWLQRYGWEIIPHPAHSPNLAPSDLHLSGLLKRCLGGMAFGKKVTSSMN
ncbi:histone-lysine N-methyltransferase SETMAR [Elysia marginata]|uniref:Histone-lysine N-methyltransferase SETMAR n=1 Tax=Elysia marginata TaxID=1093978 RepID=A0AAV4JR47_9GAST|nr:histone-lysine N-methyltransferase SETMAR [Elysia marginata]